MRVPRLHFWRRNALLYFWIFAEPFIINCPNTWKQHLFSCWKNSWDDVSSHTMSMIIFVWNTQLPSIFDFILISKITILLFFNNNCDVAGSILGFKINRKKGCYIMGSMEIAELRNQSRNHRSENYYLGKVPQFPYWITRGINSVEWYSILKRDLLPWFWTSCLWIT